MKNRIKLDDVIHVVRAKGSKPFTTRDITHDMRHRGQKAYKAVGDLICRLRKAGCVKAVDHIRLNDVKRRPAAIVNQATGLINVPIGDIAMKVRDVFPSQVSRRRSGNGTVQVEVKPVKVPSWLKTAAKTVSDTHDKSPSSLLTKSSHDQFMKAVKGSATGEQAKAMVEEVVKNITKSGMGRLNEYDLDLLTVKEMKEMIYIYQDMLKKIGHLADMVVESAERLREGVKV